MSTIAPDHFLARRQRFGTESAAGAAAAAGTATGAASGTPDTPRGGVPGTQLCRIDHPATRWITHNYVPGSHGERDEITCSGYEGGRRRAIGVVAAPQSSPERPRRWCDAGAPKAAQKAGAEIPPSGTPRFLSDT
jgi:hypothetical protein